MSINDEKYFKAISYTTKLGDKDFEQIMDLVGMNVAMNGVTEAQALILVLEQMGIEL
jgi:hypothetical protein